MDNSGTKSKRERFLKLVDERAREVGEFYKNQYIAEKAGTLAQNPALYKCIAAAGQKLIKDEMGLDNFIREILLPPAAANR